MAARELTELELDRLAVRLVELLDGLPVGQALYLLTDRAPLLLKDGHAVDVSGPRFQAIAGRVRPRPPAPQFPPSEPPAVRAI